MKRIIYISMIITNLFIACESNSDPSKSIEENIVIPGENSGNPEGNTEWIKKSWKLVGSDSVYANITTALSLAVSDDGIPYVTYIAYEDQSSNPYNGIVKKLNNNKWENVGNGIFSEASAPSDISIAVSKNGVPYITYLDSARKVNVVTLKNNKWQSMPDNASFNNAKNVSMSLSTSDEPYIAYGKDRSISVGKYSSGRFEALSSQDLGTSSVPHISLSKDKTPYIAYIDSSDNLKQSITIKKYTTTKWEVVGTEKVGEILAANKDSFTLDVYNNTPYVAYEDKNNNSKATLIKYESGSWKNVGSVGFSKQGIGMIYLKISESGTPYVLYRGMEDGTIAIMGFNGNAWQVLGTDAVSQNVILYMSLSLSKNGTPYVAYYDGTERKIIVKKFE